MTDKKFRKVFEYLGTFLIVAFATYGFLSLCNWSLNMKDWNGFSRFIMGAEGVVFLIALWDNL